MSKGINRLDAPIDREIPLGLISRKIRDQQVLWLIQVILDASNPQEPVPGLCFEGDDPAAALSRRRGIPLGNLTSQFFANLYLNGLDHFLKEELRDSKIIKHPG
ncbi:MAG: hypothetical protein HY673_20855 [Chloroflexi bacterium]|nr:hypothetical protein [Chloroflexota bacterium]